MHQILCLPGDNVRTMAEGISRGRLCLLPKTTPYLNTPVGELPAEQPIRRSAQTEALIHQTYEPFERLIKLAPKMTPDVLLSVLSSEDPGCIADYTAQNLSIRTGNKQTILEGLRPVHRLGRLCQSFRREIETLELEREMQSKMREQLIRSQWDYALRKQLKVLQQELGEESVGGDSEIAKYRQRIARAKPSQEMADKLMKEAGRLEKQPFGSAKVTVLRNYLDTVLELLWGKHARERINMETARGVLDVDHYGLERAKKHILEFLAVKQLTPGLRGQILRLMEPPGVGKASAVMSMTRVLNRKLARISLGGVHDETKVRDYRKTYMGAMPGRIIAAVKQTENYNPLLLPDEINKPGGDQRDDLASTLLEVLGVKQNGISRDRSLEVPFDLPDVLFIATVNTLGTVPRPLLDRMEIIELTSCIDEERLQIIRRHLLPKELRRHGLAKTQFRPTGDAIRELIRGYTCKTGVHVLERKLGALYREAAVGIVSSGVKSIHITEDDLRDHLGIHHYRPERLPQTEQVDVVNDLVRTQVGGEILEVGADAVLGSGKVELTGNLGSVVKKSAQAALSYVYSCTVQLGIRVDFYKTKDIHVHSLEGAVPKDNPSADIAITTAIASALTDAPIRRGTAMTGEVILRGRVLPIGGLEEKTVATYRSGIKTASPPADDMPGLEEIDPIIRAALHFVPVEQVDSVLTEALELRTCDPLRDDMLPPPESGSWSREVPTLRQ